MSSASARDLGSASSATALLIATMHNAAIKARLALFTAPPSLAQFLIIVAGFKRLRIQESRPSETPVGSLEPSFSQLRGKDAWPTGTSLFRLEPSIGDQRAAPRHRRSLSSGFRITQDFLPKIRTSVGPQTCRSRHCRLLGPYPETEFPGVRRTSRSPDGPPGHPDRTRHRRWRNDAARWRARWRRYYRCNQFRLCPNRSSGNHGGGRCDQALPRQSRSPDFRLPPSRHWRTRAFVGGGPFCTQA